MPITPEELESAVNKGGNKAPGRDSIALELFKATWGALNGDVRTIPPDVPKKKTRNRNVVLSCAFQNEKAQPQTTKSWPVS